MTSIRRSSRCLVSATGWPYPSIARQSRQRQDRNLDSRSETGSGREQWRLARPMDVSGSSGSLAGRQSQDHEQRVFKFAADGARLKGLKRRLRCPDSSGNFWDRPEFVRILEWNFETAPFFLGGEVRPGANPRNGPKSQGGLSKVPFDTRLQVLVDVAKAVAAAHDIGVLHTDSKRRIFWLCRDETQSGRSSWRRALFVDPRLQALGITNLGFTQTAGLEASRR